MKYCTLGETKSKCKLFLVETNPDITSPGYSWWDVKGPEISVNSTCDENIKKATADYNKYISTNREAKL